MCICGPYDVSHADPGWGAETPLSSQIQGVMLDALGRMFAESQNISEHLRRKKQLWPHWFSKSTIHFAVSLRILLLYDAEKKTPWSWQYHHIQI